LYGETGPPRTLRARSRRPVGGDSAGQESGRPHGAVEQFDYMKDFLVGVVKLGAGAELQEAAGVCGDDGLGAGRGGVMHFVGEQIEGRFGLRDVIDACGAAADFRVG